MMGKDSGNFFSNKWNSSNRNGNKVSGVRDIVEQNLIANQDGFQDLGMTN